MEKMFQISEEVLQGAISLLAKHPHEEVDGLIQALKTLAEVVAPETAPVAEVAAEVATEVVAETLPETEAAPEVLAEVPAV